MDIRERVMPSDWVTGIGAFILLISIFLEWFKVKGLGFWGGSVGASGWDATKLTILILLFSLAAMTVVALRIADVDLDVVPVPIGLIVIGLGGVSLLIVILRMLIHQQGLGVSYGIFISAIAAVAVTVGGVLMQREEAYY